MNLPGTMKTLTYQGRNRLNYTPAAAKAAGDIVNLGGPIFGFVDDDIEANRMGQLGLPPLALRWARKASGTTFAIGDEVWWDASAGLAVAPALTLDGAADYPLGVCVMAALDGQNGVAFIPYDILDRYNVVRPVVHEFDCDGDNGDTDEHVLIPAWMNRHGLVLKHVFALVTEVFAGSGQDQGIVTIEDEDDNVLATLTASDTAADAVGDIIIGSVDLSAATTGAAWAVVAAGKAIQGFVSQQTSGGTPAGKMKVYLDFVPLV